MSRDTAGQPPHVLQYERHSGRPTRIGAAGKIVRTSYREAAGDGTAQRPGLPEGQAHWLHNLLHRVHCVHNLADEKQLLKRATAVDRPSVVSFVNAHALHLAFDNPVFRAALESSAVLLRDGVGAAVTLRLFRRRPGRNMVGTDFIPKIVESYRGRPVALMGTTREHVRRAADYLNGLGCHVVGVMDGFAPESDYVEFARQARPALIVLGMGMPKQEMLAARFGSELDFPVLIVNGGAIHDMWSGRFRRAPYILRCMCLEWLYRLWLEPRRLWRRYLIGTTSLACKLAGVFLNVQAGSPPPAQQHRRRKRPATGSGFASAVDAESARIASPKMLGHCTKDQT